jgi:indolepyruvate decarboxylase
MITLGKFLINELSDAGAYHIFGIPGDYTLNFINEVENDTDMTYVGISREDSVGYAADAYARMKGCGVACVTYSVGGMNIMNPIAGAFAERSPVVVIAGVPNKEDIEKNPNKHHTIHDINTQKNIFDNVVCSSVKLDSDYMVENMIMIHQSIQSMKHISRPIYIEFSNKDIIREITDNELLTFKELNKDNKKTQRKFTAEIEAINKIFSDASNRVLILGHEIFRTSLENLIIDFADKLNIPVFTTLLGKSTVDENNPIVMGVLSQLSTNPEIMELVNKSDCIITMGMNNTDLDGFTFTPHFSLNMSDGVSVNGKYIGFPDFRNMITGFCEFFYDTERQSDDIMDNWRITTFKPPINNSSKDLTLEHVFGIISNGLSDEHIVISDIGESLFGMIDVPVKNGQFLSMAYYTSMSFSVPGAVGVKFAKPEKRPIVIVGDGAFQMTGSEFCSHIRYNMNSIIIILNNRGYSTERAIMDGKFNDIHNWQYEKIVDLMNGGIGKYIKGTEEFNYFFNEALNDKDKSWVFNVQISPNDMSSVMKSIADKMCKQAL